MRGRIWSAVIFCLLLPAQSRGETACVDAARLAHSTVGITRYFDEAERTARPDLLGVHGTGWFLSATTLVTAAHVAEGMKLSTQDWKQISIQDGDDIRSISVRIQRLAGLNAEKLAVLELQSAVTGARSLAIRMASLAPEERVVTLAHLEGRMRFVSGRFVKYGDGDRFAGTALLEIYEGDNRLVIDHGASGAPVLDCEGRIAAVVSNVFTRTLQMPAGTIRISTAWGDANVVSVPIQALRDFSEAR